MATALSASSGAKRTFQFRLYDVAEYSTEDYGELRNFVVCFGRNPKGERVAVFVKNVPHEIYIAVPETFSDADRLDLERSLSAELRRKNRFTEKCRFTDCPNCYPKKSLSDLSEGGSGGETVLVGSAIPDEAPESVGGSADGVENSVDEFIADEVVEEIEDVAKASASSRPSKGGKKKSFGPGSILSEPCKELRKKDVKPVVSSNFVRRRGFIGYEKNDRKFVRFVMSGAFYARDAEVFLTTKSQAFNAVLGTKKGVYEVCPSAVDSFMRIADARGFFWYECLSFKSRGKGKKATRAEHEVEIDFKDLKELATQPSPTSPEYQAPVVSLVFDIETISNRPNGVSNPLEHPIGMIGVQVVNDLDPSKNQRCVFTWGGYTPRTVQEPADDGIITKVHKDVSEVIMLMRFRSFILKVDPDFLVGYNSNNFDLPYILTRAQKLGEPSVLDLSLFLERPCRHMLVERRSNQLGTRKVSMIDLPGRTCFDLYPFTLSRLKLRRYRMQDVVEHLDPTLKKGELDYGEIFGLFYGGLEQRKRLLDYCVLDCYLTSRILQDLSGVPTLVAQSQVFRARPIDVLEKGQLARNGRLIRGWTKNEYLIPGKGAEKFKYSDCPTYTKLWGPDKSVHFEGGRVFEPERNKHELVACLDFNSLYPSIIRAHNLCHTTFVFDDKHLKSSGLNASTDVRETVDISSDAMKAMPGHEKDSFLFVKESVKEGVLPKMLTSLIEARKRTKKLRDECTDPRVKQALDAEQDSYKLCANSVYGLLGFRGELEHFAAAASVTAYGRHYIAEARTAVEKEFNNRLDFVYGDTDSIMFSLVRSCGSDLDAARKLAHEMAEFLNTRSQLFPKPMKIEFEKIFKCMLLEDKKRYAGYSFDSNIGSTKGKFFARGLETVRRDVPPYVSECLKELLAKMLIEVKGDEELLTFVKSSAGKLLLGEVPAEKLKMSAAISKPLDQYVSPARLPHVAAARSLQEMGMDVRPGDRIEYVYVQRMEGVLKSDKALAWKLFTSKDNLESLDFEEYFDKLSGPFKRALFYLPEEKLGPYFDKRRYDMVAPNGEIVPAEIRFEDPFVVKPKRKTTKAKAAAASLPQTEVPPPSSTTATFPFSHSPVTPLNPMAMVPRQQFTTSRSSLASTSSFVRMGYASIACHHHQQHQQNAVMLGAGTNKFNQTRQRPAVRWGMRTPTTRLGLFVVASAGIGFGITGFSLSMS